MPTFLRVTLPLAGATFLNQASRAVVATIGPAIALEFSLSASGLGLLAAAFFATYALAQLPIGLALDLYGPRRVQAVLALTTAAGFAMCGLAGDPWLLGLGRMVTGLGVAASLTALIKANTQWYPRDRVAAMTGAGMFVGALGGLSATLPVQWMLPLIGWRGAFLVFAALSAAAAAWIWLSVPDRPPGAAPARRTRRLREEAAEFGRIFANPVFQRFLPAVMVLSAVNFTWQGLWAGPWLRDVGGLADEARAAVLLFYALGMTVGSLLNGHATSLAQRRGFDPMFVPWLGMAGAAAVQVVLMTRPSGFATLAALWFALSFCGSVGPAAYTALGQRFAPELAGRVATAINGSMLVLVFVLQNAIGWILDLWPRAPWGGWSPAGYGWALGLTVGLQVLAGVWMAAAPRLRPASRGAPAE